MAKLTAKRRAFVEAYTGNATEAALSAGYSPKTAHAGKGTSLPETGGRAIVDSFRCACPDMTEIPSPSTC